jgi:hypothetical protein
VTSAGSGKAASKPEAILNITLAQDAADFNEIFTKPNIPKEKVRGSAGDTARHTDVACNVPTVGLLIIL